MIGGAGLATSDAFEVEETRSIYWTGGRLPVADGFAEPRILKMLEIESRIADALE